MKLGDCCKINVSSYSNKENWPVIRYLDTGNLTEGRIDEIQTFIPGKDKIPSRAKRKVKTGDILFSTVRPNQKHYGMVGTDTENLLVSTGFAVVTADSKLADSRFIYYFLTQDHIVESLHVIAEQSVSAYPSIKPSDIEGIDVPLPELAEQRKIAAILSALDDKIELNRRINANLEQQAAAIFKAWFIDAPEVRSWKKGTFALLIEKIVSGDWGKDAPSGNNVEMVYCIRGTDIPEVRVGNKGKMPTRFILPKNYAEKRLTDGDIVVEISGGSPTQSTGRAAVITSSLLNRYDKGMVCTNFCKALKPLAGYSMFIYYYWQYLYENNVFFAYENGTTGIKNLDISGFIETEPIVVAPQELITCFETLCRDYFATIYANGLENEKLAALRDALLPRLMSGEIDVSDVSL
ncbi:MAG: restriction endonuclease subunit S [Thermoguttaceae bacterium]|nr:restriction endonuclease subunit S [Thermoguttaceae bacterium]